MRVRSFVMLMGTMLGSAHVSLRAASLTASAFNNSNATDVFGKCLDSDSQSFGPVFASCSGPFFETQDAWTGVSSDAHAEAVDYTRLTAFAFQHLFIQTNNENGRPYFSSVSADASLSDDIKIPVSYHQPIFVTFSWTAEGTGVGELTLSWGGGASCMESIFSSTRETETCTKTAELFPGNTYNLQVVLQANAQLFFSGPHFGEVTQTSDFSQTAFLSGVQIFDENMVPLTGLALEAASGTDYQAGVISSTPEPQTAAVMAFSILCFSVMKYCCSRWRCQKYRPVR